MRNTSHFFATQLFTGAVLAIFVFFGIVQVFAVVDDVTAAAPTTNILGYQGRLLDSNGVPVADSSASVSFELYTALSGGSCVWSNSSTTCASATARTVTLSDGLFSEALGDAAATPAYAAIGDSIFADNAALYLQVTVNSELLTPRKRILAAGYALNSQTLDGYNTTLTGGTSAAVTVLDANGNLQLTGSPQGTGVSQGALYINPAAAVVAAGEALFGVAVDGTSRFLVDGEGDVNALGDITLSGGDITSTTALAVVAGGNISFAPSGSGLMYVTTGDDFAVGGSSLVAPFSVDESTNTVRIGDGANDSADPSIVFYASDAADSGTFAYTDSDIFSLTGGDFSHTTLGILPTAMNTTLREHEVVSTWSGAFDTGLDETYLYTLSGRANYSASFSPLGTNVYVAGTEGALQLTGSSASLSTGYGVRGSVANDSTGLGGVGALIGTGGEVVQNAANVVSDAIGVRGLVSADAGTITNAYGIYGSIDAGAGAVTDSYGGYFYNTLEGATRYGVYGNASGGATANYAGYFMGSAVHIDDDITPNTAGTATGTGDLYIADAVEADGSVSFGDSTGTDSLTFTTAASTTNAATFTLDGLTSGTGLSLGRADSGSVDFTGVMLQINQLDNEVGSSGDALSIHNAGGGDAVGLYILQDQISDETSGAGGLTTGAQALILETTEAGSDDDMVLMVAGGQVTLAIESDGSVLSDNAFSATGADYAEYFSTADATLGMSEVVCHDRESANMVERCEAANTEVLGVITPTPGFIGGLPGDDDESLRVIVGLTGQIATLATAAEGAIAIGDPVTASQTRAGYAALAQGPSRIIGFALEPLASGTGTIQVYVNPQWYGGDVLSSDGSAIISSADVVLASSATATADAATVASHDLVLRGSSWIGGTAVTQDMTLRTEAGSTDYRLSVVNTDGVEVAYVGDEGDLALAGRLYPSDRGVLQTEKYIYYDGSEGIGGDMMRTNASGWSSGSYDFAEMFPSQDMLAAGEVVVFADGKEQIRRSTGVAYDDKIAGVVSTRPAFLAGEKRIGDVPVALAGRVPTYVSGENGVIAIGDPLTTSTKAGYAMKATEPGPIVGYAMEEFSGTTGVIVTFIRPSYYDGGPTEEAPIAENGASGMKDLATLDISGSLNMNGGSILSVASLVGIGQQWRIEEDGDFFTRGRIVQIVQSYGGQEVETYASASREHTIELTGTAVLAEGKAKIDFERIDPSFNDIIANDVAYRVYLTPAGMTGMLAAVERTNEGFKIQEAGTSTGVAVDWLVVAYHKDFVPEALVISEDEQPVVEEPVAIEPVVIEPVEEIPVVEEPGEEVVVDDVPVDQDEAELVVDTSIAESPEEQVEETVPTIVELQEQP